MASNSSWEKGRQDAQARKPAYVPPRAPYQARQAYYSGYNCQTQLLNDKNKSGKR